MLQGRVKKINNLIIIPLAVIVTACSTINEKTFVKQWTINKYSIKLYHAQGTSGPDYYYYNLDKKGTVGKLFFKSRRSYYSYVGLSNCILKFNNTNENKYTFYICPDAAR
jgi:hypothetical protein